jgi:hypothetical protein
MKFSSLFLTTLLLFPISAKAQVADQSVYTVCTSYRESYVPGHHDSYGNYIQGSVTTQQYNVPCNQSASNRQPRQRYCDPNASVSGGIFGALIAKSISKPDSYGWSVPLGAVVGSSFACN